MGDEEIGYRITRLDLAKKYKLSPEIEVGEHEETQVIYGEGCTSSLKKEVMAENVANIEDEYADIIKTLYRFNEISVADEIGRAHV